MSKKNQNTSNPPTNTTYYTWNYTTIDWLIQHHTLLLLIPSYLPLQLTSHLGHPIWLHGTRPNFQTDNIHASTPNQPLSLKLYTGLEWKPKKIAMRQPFLSYTTKYGQPNNLKHHPTTQHVNFMAGHHWPIIHQLNLKARVDVENGQLKAIKAALRLSQRHVHAPMFEVGFYFYSFKSQNQSLRRLQIIWTPMSRHKVHMLQPNTLMAKMLSIYKIITYIHNLHS